MNDSNLMNLLPESIYGGNSTMEGLQGIIKTDINDLANSFDDTIDESFCETASSLLGRYEKIYGIEVDISKSDTFRRERIKAKKRGVGTVTKQLIVNTAASYSNCEVEVIEDPEDYRFTIKFVGTRGIPENMNDLTLTIEEIKPAHLSFIFEYVYNTYGVIASFTYGALEAYTYYQLRNEVIN